MHAFMNCLSKFVGFLCRVFGVVPETVKDERDKNPSPSREN